MPEQKLPSPETADAEAADYTKRSIDFYFKPEQLTQKIIRRILDYYNRGRSVVEILRLINASHAAPHQLSAPDIYAVLFHALRAKQITQRAKHLETELRIVDFPFIYKLWTRGYSLKRAVAQANDKATRERRKLMSSVAIQRLYNSFSYRFSLKRAKIELSREQAAVLVLAKAETRMIDGRVAFVIFKDQIGQQELVTLDIQAEVEEELMESQGMQKLEALLEEERVEGEREQAAKVMDLRGIDSNERIEPEYVTDEAGVRRQYQTNPPKPEFLLQQEFDEVFGEEEEDEGGEVEPESEFLANNPVLKGVEEELQVDEEEVKAADKGDELTEDQKQEKLKDIFSD